MGGQQSINQIFVNAPKSICRVETETFSGFAGLYCFKEMIGTFNVLITSRNVLKPDLFSAKFFFNGVQEFKLDKSWIGQITSQPFGSCDFTVIELKQAAINFFINNGAIFLKVASPRIHDKIIITQYSEEKFSFVHGAIHEIQGFTLKHNAATADGSIGSPLLLLNGDAVGVLIGREQLYLQQNQKISPQNQKNGDEVGVLKGHEQFHSQQNQKIGPLRLAICPTEIIRSFLLDIHVKYLLT